MCSYEFKDANVFQKRAQPLNVWSWTVAACRKQQEENEMQNICIFFVLYAFDSIFAIWRPFRSFQRESTMTRDYRDVSNWPVGDSSVSVRYKSLVIGFLRWSAPVTELTELWEELAWGPISPCLRGSGMSAPEGWGGCLFLKKRRGRPARRAVHHQTSQCVKLLAVSSQS